MAAFKNNNCALMLLVISLSSLFLSLTFAHDLPSPTPAPTVEEVEVEDLSPGAAPVSYISSSPDGSPASAPSPASPQPSDSSSSSTKGEVYGILDSSSSTEGEVYGILETSAVSVPVKRKAAGKDIQDQVSKVVQSSVIAVKFQTERFIKQVIAERLRDPATEAETRTCLTQCKENYEDANDDISKVVDDLSTGDYYKAMVDVEGISTFVDTCYDCLKEMVGDEPEFKKFDDWVRGVTGDCLDQLDKINS